MALPPGNAFNLGNVYPNAFFDYLSRLLPRKLKLLFKWLEYLYANCGQVFSVIKKFSEYSITTITYETGSEDNKKRLSDILEKHIKIKSAAINVGIDFFIYGNTFVSLFRPFQRWLVCTKCKTKYNALNYPYEWMPQKFEFRIKCEKPECQFHGIAKVEHDKLSDPKKLRMIRWDPKEIDINTNPITGESEHYYTIPQHIKDRIRNKKPDKFLLNTMPWELIETIKARKVFKFRENQLFHMKAPSPAGINQEWGFPGLLGAMKPFFYTAILRKANEALALERIVPWRVMYPQASAASNDPAQYANLSRWKAELTDAVRKWRKDPNMVKLSPIPVGVTEIGGNAKNLMVANEIAQTEEGIVTGMGVPKEFIYGGLTHAGGSVTLRMLENLLFTYTDQLVDLLQWVSDGTCDFIGLEKIKIGMTDFKLVDDIQQKQLIGQLFSQNKVSTTTFLKSLDIDAEKEREQMIEDQVADAKMQKTVAMRLKDLERSLADKVDAQISGNPLQYDPSAVIQVAQGEAQTLLGLPEEDRKVRLGQINAQDPVLHAVVEVAMREMQRQQKEQGVQQLQGATANPQPQLPAVSPIQSGGGSPSTTMTGR